MFQLRYNHHCNPIILDALSGGIATYLIDAVIVFIDTGSFSNTATTGIPAAVIIIFLTIIITTFIMHHKSKLLHRDIKACIEGIIDSDTLNQANEYVYRADNDATMLIYSSVIKGCFESLFIDKRRLLDLETSNRISVVAKRMEINQLIHHFQAKEDQLSMVLGDA